MMPLPLTAACLRSAELLDLGFVVEHVGAVTVDGGVLLVVLSLDGGG